MRHKFLKAGFFINCLKVTACHKFTELAMHSAKINVDCTMPNSEQNLEVCDATGFDSSNAAWYKKIIAQFYIF